MGSFSLLHWIVVLIVIISLPVLCIYTGRRTRTPSGPVGFGGWLLLLAFGQTITPLITLIMLVAMVTGPHGLGEVVLLIPLLAFQVYVTVIMYRRWSRFPKLFVIEQIAIVAVMLVVDTSSSLGIGGDIGRSFIESVIGAAIWSAYVLTSIRVRNTFVKDRRTSAIATTGDT